MSIVDRCKLAAARVRPDPAPGTQEHAQALARLTFQAGRLGVSFQPRYFACRRLDDAREYILAAAATAAPPATVPSQAPTPAEAALLARIVGPRAGMSDDAEEEEAVPAAPATPAKGAAPAPATSALDRPSPDLAAALEPIIATINARNRRWES